MCKRYYEDDRPVKIPKRYMKWSDQKIERVLRRHECWTRLKNRFKPRKQDRIEYLEKELKIKIICFEDKSSD